MLKIAAKIAKTGEIVEAAIDNVDSEQAQYPWSAIVKKNGEIYFLRRKSGRTVYLHREILGCKDGEEADHISRNTLDCRRSNLRKATRSQQNYSRRHPVSRSGFVGVYTTGSGFFARLGKKYLGHGKDPVALAKLRDEAGRNSENKDFVRFNF